MMKLIKSIKKEHFGTWDSWENWPSEQTDPDNQQKHNLALRIQGGTNPVDQEKQKLAPGIHSETEPVNAISKILHL